MKKTILICMSLLSVSHMIRPVGKEQPRQSVVSQLKQSQIHDSNQSEQTLVARFNKQSSAKKVGIVAGGTLVLLFVGNAIVKLIKVVPIPLSWLWKNS